MFKPNNIVVVPTLEDKILDNACWCATFQLVWNDMKNTLVKGDVIFNPESEIVKNLNKETFKENMLSNEYYYKIYGPKTLELKKQIEKEIKNKFNQKSDKFKAPMIELDVLKTYTELENKPFRTYSNEEITIENAIQTIKFSLNEKGGKIKSEAAIGIKMTSLIHEEIRTFEINDTFALFIKESNKNIPYLALKVNDITKFQV